MNGRLKRFAWAARREIIYGVVGTACYAIVLFAPLFLILYAIAAPLPFNHKPPAAFPGGTYAVTVGGASPVVYDFFAPARWQADLYPGGSGGSFDHGGKAIGAWRFSRAGEGRGTLWLDYRDETAFSNSIHYDLTYDRASGEWRGVSEFSKRTIVLKRRP